MNKHHKPNLSPRSFCIACVLVAALTAISGCAWVLPSSWLEPSFEASNELDAAMSSRIGVTGVDRALAEPTEEFLGTRFPEGTPVSELFDYFISIGGQCHNDPKAPNAYRCRYCRAKIELVADYSVPKFRQFAALWDVRTVAAPVDAPFNDQLLTTQSFRLASAFREAASPEEIDETEVCKKAALRLQAADESTACFTSLTIHQVYGADSQRCSPARPSQVERELQ